MGAGVFGVVAFIIMADLTEGSGRFNISMAFMGVMHSIGAAVSQKLGPAIVASRCEEDGGCKDGYNVAFLTLGLIGLIPVGLQLFFMPETKIWAIGEPRRQLFGCCGCRPCRNPSAVAAGEEATSSGNDDGLEMMAQQPPP